MRSNQQLRQDRLIKGGLCSSCGKNPLATKRYCRGCADKVSARSRAARSVNRRIWFRRGTCVECGKRPIATTRSKRACAQCLDEQKARYYARKRKAAA